MSETAVGLTMPCLTNADSWRSGAYLASSELIAAGLWAVVAESGGRAWFQPSAAFQHGLGMDRPDDRVRRSAYRANQTRPSLVSEWLSWRIRSTGREPLNCPAARTVPQQATPSFVLSAFGPSSTTARGTTGNEKMINIIFFDFTGLRCFLAPSIILQCFKFYFPSLERHLTLMLE